MEPLTVHPTASHRTRIWGYGMSWVISIPIIPYQDTSPTLVRVRADDIYQA